MVVNPTAGNLGSIKTSDRSLGEQAGQDASPDTADAMGGKDIESFVDPQDKL
jgi:hypothetical protein